MGEYEEAIDRIIGAYADKDTIMDKVKNDKALLEELLYNWDTYDYCDDYNNYDEYLKECFECIEENIMEMIIE